MTQQEALALARAALEEALKLARWAQSQVNTDMMIERFKETLEALQSPSPAGGEPATYLCYFCGADCSRLSANACPGCVKKFSTPPAPVDELGALVRRMPGGSTLHHHGSVRGWLCDGPHNVGRASTPEEALRRALGKDGSDAG